MKHLVLKTKPHFLDLAINGNKKHEYRLCTPDRCAVSNGDRIILVSNQDPGKMATFTIRKIVKYPTWEEGLSDNWEEDFKDKYETFDEALDVCSKLYSRNQITTFGLIVYTIEPIKRKTHRNRVLLDTNIIIQRESYNNVAFDVVNLYKWLEKLKSTKLIHQLTREEILKHKSEEVRKNMITKLNSYDCLVVPNKLVFDDFFAGVVSRFSQDRNSVVDNNILYQVFIGNADILITNDRTILKKAELLGIRELVVSSDEYLRIVEKEHPGLIEYKMLSVKKEQFGNIDINDSFFDSLKEDYPEFSDWFASKNQEEAYVFRQKNKVHAFLYVKTEYETEEDYLKIYPPLKPKKRMKIGTFKIDEELKGFKLSERFLKIIFDNAINNNAEEIYVTMFEDRRKEINNLRDVLKNWGFVYHGYKNNDNGEKESVFIKTLNKYDKSKSVKFNFPNMPNEQKLFMLPIYPEYHTDLFPDAILKNEDMSLYSENKAHLYSLEKIYVSGASTNGARPGDFVVIYRSGERWPKKYSSVCTGLAIIEEISKPDSLDDYLNLCSNKSVFEKKTLMQFYNDKKYKTVIKLIPYKTYFKKISLNELIGVGLVDQYSGPRPFDIVPENLYTLFLNGGEER